ncbi:MAG: hypothetical protein HKN12_03035, partial [Gemmatimonadetes bacterium]|nr:hypothetical protein [Gemmatimonadota bacterium]
MNAIAALADGVSEPRAGPQVTTIGELLSVILIAALLIFALYLYIRYVHRHVDISGHGWDIGGAPGRSGGGWKIGGGFGG